MVILSKRGEPPVGSTSAPQVACRAPDLERCNPEAVEKAKAVELVAAENRTAAVAKAIGIARRWPRWRAALAVSRSLPEALLSPEIKTRNRTSPKIAWSRHPG